MGELEVVGRWSESTEPIRQKGKLNLLVHLRDDHGGTYTKMVELRLRNLGGATMELAQVNPADVIERIEVVDRVPDQPCVPHHVAADSVVRDGSGFRGRCSKCFTQVQLEAVPGGDLAVEIEALRSELLLRHVDERQALQRSMRLARQLEAERSALDGARAMLAEITSLATDG
jgi:hypothetical protein